MAGLSVSGDFSRIDGALTVTAGHGKYLRLIHSVAQSTHIPAAIADHCRVASDPQQSDLTRVAAALADLAEVQATLVEQLKTQAGKYVDRVMAVSVVDPGIWPIDFDDRIAYLGFCNAARLAELSGLTVIDAFPEQDIAAGGCGHPLDAMPLWLMLADRNPKVAQQNKAILITEEHRGYWLPASDGLDAELPAIAEIRLDGFRYLKWLQQRSLESDQDAGTNRDGRSSSRLERLYCDGQSDNSLQLEMQNLLNRGEEQNSPTENVAEELWDLAQAFLKTSQQRLPCLDSHLDRGGRRSSVGKPDASWRAS